MNIVYVCVLSDPRTLSLLGLFCCLGLSINQTNEIGIMVVSDEWEAWKNISRIKLLQKHQHDSPNTDILMLFRCKGLF